MVIAILSDTHIPGQAERIPDEFRGQIGAADYVIHAGDFGSKEALENMQTLSTDLTSVYGNADPPDIDLPAVASVAVNGVVFVVSHGIVNFVQRAVSNPEGVVFDRDDWLDAIADTTRARADTEEPIVGIGGHTHQVEDETHDGVRVVNPGSATGVGPADGTATMMTAEVTDSGVDVTVHRT